MIKRILGPLFDKYYAYRLQKAIAILKDRTNTSKEAYAVIRALDAAAAKRNKLGMNPASVVLISVTRGELAGFVQYMTKIHDTKLTMIQELKYAVTGLLMSRHLTDEDVENLKAGKSRIILPDGTGNRVQRRLRAKALAKKGYTS